MIFLFRKDNFLICVQTTKTSSIMKWREYKIVILGLCNQLHLFDYLH